MKGYSLLVFYFKEGKRPKQEKTKVGTDGEEND